MNVACIVAACVVALDCGLLFVACVVAVDCCLLKRADPVEGFVLHKRNK